MIDQRVIPYHGLGLLCEVEFEFEDDGNVLGLPEFCSPPSGRTFSLLNIIGVSYSHSELDLVELEENFWKVIEEEGF